MSLPNSLEWYLVRTKPHKERWVRDQLGKVLPDVFLPMLKTRAPQWGKLAPAIVPLFPCYIFARFVLKDSYFDIKYARGVSGLVSAGQEPIAVPSPIVDEIRKRGADGVVELIAPELGRGEKVRVVDGPFKGFEAVFERYLTGSERVAILLEAIQTQGVRVVLPAGFVSQYG